MPHQCAHWFAMTCRRQRRGYVCKGAVHDDIQRMETACGCKAVFAMDTVGKGTRIATPVCALARNDMLKTGRCARVQERTAGVLLETPLQSHSRRMFLHVIAQTSLQPLTRHRLLHVIANRCMGPRKGAPFVGRGAPRERCPALAFGRSWAWRTLGRRGAAIRFPAEKLCQSVILKANS